MPVNAAAHDEPNAGTERADQLLAAACRVLTHRGTRGLSLRDVAEEAGVSKTLIHYYFSSRDDLLVKAYEFADQRGRDRVRQLLPDGGTAVERLAHLLRLYLGDEAEIRQDWILWSELSSAAVFEEDLRPVMARSFARWTDWIESMVHDAVLEGALEPTTDTAATALRLIAAVDGLGALLVRELIDHARAHATLETILAGELGVGDGSAAAAADERVAPSSAYLRHLAGLVRSAVEALEVVAEGPQDAGALRAVAALIDRAAGWPPSAPSPAEGDVGRS